MKDDELRSRLSDEEYRVTQEKETEQPFNNEYWNVHEDGTYHCKVCGAPLFLSKAKYDSGTGWPSFDSPVSPDAVKYVEDASHGMRRTEIVCGTCGAHLGHVFDDGPRDPSVASGKATGKRFCANSASLSLKKDKA